MFTSRKEYTSKEFKRLVCQNDLIVGCKFYGCTFSKCSLQETIFDNCTFQQCTFIGCDLSLAGFRACIFNTTRFEDSKLIGINWIDTNLAQTRTIFTRPVDFVKCILNHSVFIGAKLVECQITRSVAKQVSFEEADLSRADCRYTDFIGSRFLHTNLTQADFTGATNYLISPGLNTIKETRFSLPDALSLLYNLDIILTNPQTGEIVALS